MTAQTMPAQPAEDTTLRPLPWRRMAGVIWRQHRFALVTVAVVFGGAAIYLWLVGSTLHNAYAAAVACHPVGSAGCQDLVNTFNGLDSFLSNGIIIQVLPVLIGAFIGAPLLAREIETGTFRYTWTQGFGRWRWTFAKLAALGLSVTVAAELFSLVLGWFYQPYFSTANYALGVNEISPFNSGLFDLGRVTFAAWTLAAFATGALAGILVRRVIPAMFATLAACGGLAFATGAFLRGHYAAPLTSTNPDVNTHGAWVISQVWSRGGSPASLDMIRQTLHAIDVQALTPGLFQPGPATPPSIDPLHYLVQHGYTLLTTYQPASRFWAFQWIEGGWLLALSVLLIASTVWLVRRRAV